MRRHLAFGPERLLLGVGALVAAVFCWEVWLHGRAVPAALRYVPEDSPVWVASGPLGEVWEGARPHLAGYFDAEAPGGIDDTPMREWARSTRERLDKAGIVLRGPQDLPAIGIEPAAGAALAVLGRGRAGAVLVVPVRDRERFVDAVRRFTGKPLQPVEGDGAPLLRVQERLFLAFGDDGAAVISDDEAGLRELLGRQSQQAAHHRSLDRDARVFEQLRREGPAAPGLLGRIRDGGLPLPLIGEFHFAVDLLPATLALRLRAPWPVGRSATLAQVLAPPPPPGERGHAALERAEAALMFADRAWPDVVRLLAAEPALQRTSGLEQTFPTLLQQLRGTRTLRRISVATVETRRPVPGVLLGLEVSAPDADAIVLGAQTALRVKRDRELLQAAAARLTAPAGSAEAVLASGLLATRNDPLWARYRGPPERAAPTPPLQAADFAGPAYTRRRGDAGPLRYLMPPVTDDDLAWRLQPEGEGSAIRTEAMRAGRYRLCSVYADGTLWVGTDAAVLEDWLARLQRDSASRDVAAAAATLPQQGQAAKVLAAALPRQLLAAAELHPDPRVAADRRASLADLQGYRALMIAATPDPDRRELQLDVRFVRH